MREFRFDQLKSTDEQWIRYIHEFDKDHYLIICCTYDQAKAFSKVHCIEMDLSFKMVQGKTNVFSIAGWDDQVKRMFSICFTYQIHLISLLGTDVYCYAFINLETRESYAIMFHHIFRVLGEVARCPVQFPYIHRTQQGIRTVTVDMCKKQAPGKILKIYIYYISV
jgi:hypothetical protein